MDSEQEDEIGKGRAGEKGQVTLGHLFTLICYADPAIAPIVTAIRANAGFGGYVFASFLGLALGFVCGWTWWKIGFVLWTRRERFSEGLLNFFYTAHCIVALPWAFSWMGIGIWITSRALGARIG